MSSNKITEAQRHRKKEGKKDGGREGGQGEHASSRLSINVGRLEPSAKALEAAVGLKIVNAPTTVNLRLLSPSR